MVHVQAALGLHAARPPRHLRAAHQPRARADEQERGSIERSRTRPRAPRRERKSPGLEFQDESPRAARSDPTGRRMRARARSAAAPAAAASVVARAWRRGLLFAGAVALYLRDGGRRPRRVRRPRDRGARGRRVRQVVRARDRRQPDRPRARPTSVAARPLLESVVEAVVQTERVPRPVRGGGRRRNRLFFTATAQRARSTSPTPPSRGLRGALGLPKLAGSLPAGTPSAGSVTCAGATSPAQTLHAADAVRVLGDRAAAAGAAGVRRPRSWWPRPADRGARGGSPSASSGALLAIVAADRAARLASRGLQGEDAITDADIRGRGRRACSRPTSATCSRWALLLGASSGWSSRRRPRRSTPRTSRPARRLRRRLVAPPPKPVAGGPRGAGALGLGMLVVLNPTLALQLAAIGAGALLVFFGASELLALSAARRGGRGRAHQRRAFGAGRSRPPRTSSASAALAQCSSDLAREGPERQASPRRALGRLQRIGGALRAAPQRSRLRRDPQLVLRRRQPGLDHLQPAPHDPAPAARRDSAAS